MRWIAAIVFTSFPVLATLPAWANGVGPPSDRFVQTWSAIPTQSFTLEERAASAGSKVSVVAAHPGAVSDSVVADNIASIADATFRRDLAIDEMTSGWGPTQRAALEELREAQRHYVETAGGDADTRDTSFVALLHQVSGGSGRSVAQDGRDPDAVLNAVYDRVIRDAPDTTLPAIEASETAWIAYRDAFDRFARAMDRSDAARTIHDDLSRHRADELEAYQASNASR